MRKLLLSTMLVVAFGYAQAQTEQAQTEQGGWIVGASSNLSFSSISLDGEAGEDGNLTSFNLDTRVGYFVIENLSLGLLLYVTKISQDDGFVTSTVIGPWARYYVGGSFFIGASYFTVGDDTEKIKFSEGLLMLEGGYPIFIGDNVAIEPALNYSISSGDFDEDALSTFGLAVGFSLYF